MSDEDTDQEFNELLLMLRETRGFDFTGYKRTTLQRRLRRRMDSCGLSSLSEYRDYLELEPGEFARLFDSLLINVTGFFRDPAAWQVLGASVLPELLSANGPRRPIRAWSAGCATGEEAYTLAIVLAETIGIEDFIGRVKIYATDLDEDALQQARAGIYAERQVAGVTGDLREKYFEGSGTGYAFRRDMRRQIIFGRNDLTRDAPISRIDLLLARNTLMYFNAETQSAIIRKFHFALTDPGFLFLGKAEMLLHHSDEFEPVDLRRRLFRKVGSPAVAKAPRPPAASATGSGEPAAVLEAAALAAGPVAQLAIDRAGRLAAANLRAQSLFGLRPRDVGRPFQDLEVSYRPIELRSIIEHVNSGQRPVELTDVAWHRMPGTETNIYDVSVVPLYRNAGEQVGVGISFLDVTRYRRLRDDLERSNRDLEYAYEKLQSLNGELETTNEELQSTNEELETTNEELQSANEELQSANDVLRLRSGELDQANGFLSAVLRSLGNAVVVVTIDLRVRVWSSGAEDMWGVRSGEAEGMFLSDLDIGLPVGQLTPLLRQTLNGRPGRMVVNGRNRRGRPLRMEVRSRLLADPEGRAQAVIVVMSETANER